MTNNYDTYWNKCLKRHIQCSSFLDIFCIVLTLSLLSFWIYTLVFCFYMSELLLYNIKNCLISIFAPLTPVQVQVNTSPRVGTSMHLPKEEF